MHFTCIALTSNNHWRKGKIRRKWNKFWCPICIYFLSKLIHSLCTISLSFNLRRIYKRIFNKHELSFYGHTYFSFIFFLWIDYFFDNKIDKRKYGLSLNLNDIPAEIDKFGLNMYYVDVRKYRKILYTIFAYLIVQCNERYDFQIILK